MNLQVEHGKAAHQLQLNALALNELRRLWNGIHTIIVDEISMVLYEMLLAIHQRLCEIFATDDIFGGLNVIAVGDFYQLSPVNGHYIFSTVKRQSKRLASHLWRDFFNMIELEDNMRQRNDQSYLALLNRIRTGDHTEEDMAILMTRTTESKQVNLSESPFARLFPRVSDCDLHNDHELHKLLPKTEVLSLEASHIILENRRCTYGAVSYAHVREELIPDDDKECGGLPRRLKLAIGSEVMLRRNIKCGDGLVNGARGVIVSFKWLRNAVTQPSPGELPEQVFIKFHDPRVGQLSKVPIENGQQEAVPIEPMSVKFYGRQGTVLQRTQLPLILCWAATLHKVQGLSMDAAVLDLGDKVFEPGMAYVALSRVRTLDGVALSSFEPLKVKANKRIHEEMKRLRQKSAACVAVDLDTTTSHAQPSKQSISSPDIQSIPPTVCVPNIDTPLVQSLQCSLKAIVHCADPNSNLMKKWRESHGNEIAAVMLEVNQPSRASFNSFHEVDVVVQEKLLPAFTSQYVPVLTTGSGNCMYNMISLALTGTEQYMVHLRLLTAYSLILHRGHMVEIIRPTATVLLRHQERSAATITHHAEKQWLDLLRGCLQEMSWGNQFHLHALSLILERCICLYGIMRHRILQHEDKQLPAIAEDISATQLQGLFDAKDKRLNNSIAYYPHVERYSPFWDSLIHHTSLQFYL